uniref:Uncharacterized protein n=1 Tax=Anguilla anguilla TaxID=7936 RepID=A0A0E9XRB6_ANGAN
MDQKWTCSAGSRP